MSPHAPNNEGPIEYTDGFVVESVAPRTPGFGTLAVHAGQEPGK